MSKKKQMTLQSAELLTELKALPEKRMNKRQRAIRAWEILGEAMHNDDFPILADFGMEHGLFRSCTDLHANLSDGQAMGSIVWVNPVDGSQMVWIPPGPFVIGPIAKNPYYRTTPELKCEGFSLARYPVTNAQFKVFMDETGYEPDPNHDHRDAFLAHWKKGAPPKNKEDHPVTWVSYVDALAYCEWAGLNLPSEWLWEKAARGPDGRTYPWGEAKPTKKLVNFASKGTTPNGKYANARTPYGCEDMIGNVSEWCIPVSRDAMETMPKELPQIDLSQGAQQTVVRGACYLRNNPQTLAAWYRRMLSATRRNRWVGFRPAFYGPWCAAEI